MKISTLIILTSCGLGLGLSASCKSSPETTQQGGAVSEQPNATTAPVAKRVDKILETHGHRRVDPYFWLRDDDREEPEILAYLEAENAYTGETLAHTEALQTELFEEIKGRLEQDTSSVPVFFQGYWYYSRYEEGREYPIYARKKTSLDADEEVLLDVNVLAKEHSYYNVGDYDVSDDDKILAFSEDTLSRRVYDIRFKDLATGELLPDKIEGVAPGITWAADNKTVYYVRRDATTLRAFQVWKHILGQPASEDALVFEESDESFSVYTYRSRSREQIILHSGSTLTDEVLTLPADKPERDFQVFLPRERGHEYSVTHAGGAFYVRTNWEAKNFRFMKVDPAHTSDRSKWVEVIPHREDVYLTGVDLFAKHMVVSERVDGMSQVRVQPEGASDEGYTITFDDAAYDVYTNSNPEYDTTTLRLSYTSLTTPRSVFDYDMVAKTRELKKQDKVIGGFDPADYVSERIMAEASDGTKIPMSIVYRRDLDRSKPAPLYQYGYGSYGYSMDPYFSASRLSLLDRGFIFAIAHIRGGQEFGRRWYEDGKLLNKMNTFTDFIDCSKHLIARGYTSPDKLVISGGSAGGLLVGAVANMAPELYGAVVAKVPFVDVVTTMLDESIPLTTFEYDEWGNPSDEQYYKYMLSYSPYDNVVAQDYPNMLVLTGLHDSQVQYWEPAKWVAKLRATKTDKNRLLFRTNMETGHSGASGRFARFEEIALEYAFILDTLGMTEPE